MPKRKGPKKPPAKYTVGYGHPPKKTQFKPGESGNPKGRPKGSRSVGAILQDILQQKISVTENGKTKRLPALEVTLRRLANEAMRGDRNAIKLLLLLVDRYGDTAGSAVQVNDLLAEDQAILDHFLQQTPNAKHPVPPSKGA